MKEAFQLAALCVCAATVLVVLRQARPEIAAAFSLAAGAIILLALSDRLGESVQVIREVAKQADAGNGTETLLRVAGIGALLARWAASFAGTQERKEWAKKWNWAAKS